jgi:hypothetical protein
MDGYDANWSTYNLEKETPPDLGWASGKKEKNNAALEGME